jgi:hypothetical protein
MKTPGWGRMLATHAWHGMWLCKERKHTRQHHTQFSNMAGNAMLRKERKKEEEEDDDDDDDDEK